MVKYSVDAIKPLLNPIEKLQGRPQFISLYKIAHQLSDNIRKVDHPIHPDDGYSGYMMAVQVFQLFNTVPWEYTVYVGTFFKVPTMSITDDRPEV